MKDVASYFGRVFKATDGTLWDVVPGEGFLPEQVVTVKQRPSVVGEGRKLRPFWCVDMTEECFEEWLDAVEEVGQQEGGGDGQAQD